jgi:cell division protein FtsB
MRSHKIKTHAPRGFGSQRKSRTIAYTRPRSSNWLLYKRVLLGLLSFAIFAFLKVWQNVSVDQMIRESQKLHDRLTSVHNENIVLEAKIEELKSMERITSIAGERLGLVNAPKINLEEKGTLDKIADKITALTRSIEY